jgi:hypothetical protein
MEEMNMNTKSPKALHLCGTVAALLLWLTLVILPGNAMARPPSPTGAALEMETDHGPWGLILSRYIVTRPDGLNLFAYGRVTPADRNSLAQYIKALEATPVSRLPRDAQMAFWINLYNAKTIDIVLAHYPVKSIRDISLGGLFTIGPWKQKNMTVEGKSLSLDDIEHNILRKQWKDPRIHYAVNCASMGCPNLGTRPFTPGNLEAMLDEGARSFVNHPRGASVSNGRLTLSRIWQWYRDDFGRTDADIIRHVSQYAAPALRHQLDRIREIDGYDYDWTLNEAK